MVEPYSPGLAFITGLQSGASFMQNFLQKAEDLEFSIKSHQASYDEQNRITAFMAEQDAAKQKQTLNQNMSGVSTKGEPGGTPGLNWNQPWTSDIAAGVISPLENPGGNPNTGVGGTDLSGYPAKPGYHGFPDWPGKTFTGPDGKTFISHAFGDFQFQPDTWKKYAEVAGVDDISKESQRKVFDAAYAAEGLRPWENFNSRIKEQANVTRQQLNLLPPASASVARTPAPAAIPPPAAPAPAPANLVPGGALKPAPLPEQAPGPAPLIGGGQEGTTAPSPDQFSALTPNVTQSAALVPFNLSPGGPMAPPGAIGAAPPPVMAQAVAAAQPSVTAPHQGPALRPATMGGAPQAPQGQAGAPALASGNIAALGQPSIYWGGPQGNVLVNAQGVPLSQAGQTNYVQPQAGAIGPRTLLVPMQVASGLYPGIYPTG